jgi:hypothetical protein
MGRGKNLKVMNNRRVGLTSLAVFKLEKRY